MALSSSSMSKLDTVESFIAPGFFFVGTLSAMAVVILGSKLLKLKTAKRKIKVLGVISAQGKPLAMIQTAWEKARMASTLNHVVVATDDQKIADGCESFGADTIITSESCRNGIECCIEALQKKGLYDIIFNVQWDASLIEPKIIDAYMNVQRERSVIKYRDETRRDWVTCVDLKLLENRGYDEVVQEVNPNDILKISH